MKSKLTPQRIAEINREIKERFGKLPTSSFRCWYDEVIIKLKTSPDRVVFDAILSTEFATPDCAEWRKKHDVSMKNIEDELLVANGEITAVNKQIQPLNDIQVRWLREWFANNPDEVTTPEQPTIAKNKPRRTKTIMDFILLDDDAQKQKFLNKLHTLIDGNIGKYVAFVIRTCVKHGLMRKPKFPILVDTFGYIGDNSGYRKYYKLPITQEDDKNEIKGIETHILPFLDSI